MGTQETQHLAERYLEAVWAEAGAPSQLPMREALWLIEHATRLSALRLKLLRALQAALPRSEGAPAGLKDLLTDLIIMQSRLADREARLRDLLGQASEGGAPAHVSLAEADLRDAVQDVTDAMAHLRAVAGMAG